MSWLTATLRTSAFSSTTRTVASGGPSAVSSTGQRPKPYWAAITPGCALGYRKGAGGGTWIARRYDPQSTPRLRYHALGAADDVLEPDGAAALSFAQAQEQAREWLSEQARVVKGIEPEESGPYTVNRALDAYISKLENEGKASAEESRHRADTLIRPALGSVEIRHLTASTLRKFLQDLADSPARLRGRKGAKPTCRPAPVTPEAKRARRSSANRTWSVLRAALNLAFADGKVQGDAAWRRVKPFQGVDAARLRWLTVEEAQRLINASPSDFRGLVTAALLTGARYGELARLNVEDFNPDAATLTIRHSKTGRARHVFVTDEGQAFVARLAAGRDPAEPLLQKADGSRWGRSHQLRPMAEACKAAKLTPPIGFHGLRHTYASLAVMRGAPLNVVAHNLGHTTTRMVEKHYGHLAPSYIAEMIRKTAPKFGVKADGKVVRLHREGSAPDAPPPANISA